MDNRSNSISSGNPCIIHPDRRIRFHCKCSISHGFSVLWLTAQNVDGYQCSYVWHCNMDVSETATGECHTSGDIVYMTAAQHLAKEQPLLHQERFQECDCKRCAQGMRAGFPVSQVPRSLPAYLLSFPAALLPSFPIRFLSNCYWTRWRQKYS